MPATLAPNAQTRRTPTPLIRARFTLDGSDSLENHLGQTCTKVLAGINQIIPASRLQAVALGGGYGRGEGGVLRTPSGDQPYNDLEFYVFAAGHPWFNERRYKNAVHELSEELTAQAGVEVEFKITSLANLRRSAPSIFYHDLVLGHRWLSGSDDLLRDCEHHRNAALIPPSEATRLMMNRCSGLLLAREKLEHEPFTEEDADFVFRNMSKAQLAMGDAVLTVFGQYHWSCQERHSRLRCLPPPTNFLWMDAVRNHHAAGVKFKLHPNRSTHAREALQLMLHDLSKLALNLWLWLESLRLRYRFETVRDYGLSRINKWPGTSLWRNWLTNVKLFGPKAMVDPRSRRHPRNRILNALTILLWADPRSSDELEPIIRRELWTSGAIPCVQAYQQRWRHVG